MHTPVSKSPILFLNILNEFFFEISRNKFLFFLFFVFFSVLFCLFGFFFHKFPKVFLVETTSFSVLFFSL